MIGITQQLIVKAADFLSITSRKESDVTLKKLQEKVEDLERARVEAKQEFMAEKGKLEDRLYLLETEKNSSIRNEKLLEERLKYSVEDKEKGEKALQEKWVARL